MKRRILIVMAALAVCASLALPALALAPVQFAIPEQRVGPVLFARCPNFAVVAETTQGGTVIAQTDETAIPLSTASMMDVELALYSTADPTRRLIARGHWSQVLDAPKAAGEKAGPIVNLLVPWVGPASFDTGSVSFAGPTGPVTLTGQRALYDPKQMDLTTLCGAFEQ